MILRVLANVRASSNSTHLAVVFGESSFVIERIDVTRPALHEQKNHAFGTRSEVWLPGGQRIGASPTAC